MTTTLWLRECPNDDQGLVRPLLTTEGAVVLFCDSCGTVWLRPQDVDAEVFSEPAAPDWAAGPGLHLRPGTTRWAERADLTRPPWADLQWRELPDAG